MIAQTKRANNRNASAFRPVTGDRFIPPGRDLFQEMAKTRDAARSLELALEGLRRMYPKAIESDMQEMQAVIGLAALVADRCGDHLDDAEFDEAKRWRSPTPA